METTSPSIPFDLERALAGAKLRTRDGRPVSEFKRCRSDASSYPFEAKVDGKWITYTRRGTVWIGRPDCGDLVMENA